MKKYFYIAMFGWAVLLRGVGGAEPSSPPPETSASTAVNLQHEVKHTTPANADQPLTDGKSSPKNPDDPHIDGHRLQPGLAGGMRQALPTALNPLGHREGLEVNAGPGKLPPVSPAGIGQPFLMRSAGPVAGRHLTPLENNSANAPGRRPALQPAGVLLTAAPGHGPAPAAIGGSADAKAKNAGTINGAAVNHKP
jgi:hypothetical protein